MKRKELKFYIGILIIFNVTLLFGNVFESMIFEPGKVMDGQFYRIFTHMFVHVSWYHLLLDGTAFLILYSQLTEKSFALRSLYVASASLGSVAAVTIAAPYINSVGYCGLSGVAHGLMAVSALEMITSCDSDRTVKLAGLISLLIVCAKSIFEALTGEMFWEFFHFGLMANPVAVSHLGGVIGATALFGLIHLRLKTHAQTKFTPAYPSRYASASSLHKP